MKTAILCLAAATAAISLAGEVLPEHEKLPDIHKTRDGDAAMQSAAADWKAIESKLGVKVPHSMRQFFESGHRVEYYSQPELTKIANLDEIWPGMPLRFVPVLPEQTGDRTGLYYPRTESSPFIVDFSHDDGSLTCLTSDLQNFFQGPDAYCYNNPKNNHESMSGKRYSGDSTGWRQLKISISAKFPERELLKPLALNTELLESRLEETFAPLIDRFSATEGVDGAIRKCFRKPTDVLNREQWFKLTDALCRREAWTEALQALDNCHASHFVYPYYGHAPKKSHPRWTPVLEVLERMAPIIKEHGDAFDRVALKKMTGIAREWAKDEAK